MKLRFSQAAIADAKTIHDFIANEDPAAASRVIERIAHTIEFLQDFPRLGHVGVVPDALEMPVPGLPYVVVYQAIPSQEVVILRIYHVAQDRR